MPQMSPMNWKVMFNIFILMIMLTSIIINFMMIPITIKKINYKKNYKKITKKW